MSGALPFSSSTHEPELITLEGNTLSIDAGSTGNVAITAAEVYPVTNDVDKFGRIGNRWNEVHVRSAITFGTSCAFLTSTTRIDCVDLHYTGSIVNASDDRIKHNETPITNGLSSMRQLRPLTYMNSGTPDNTDQSTWFPASGFVAQEVQGVLPDIVSQSESGLYGVNYIGLYAHAVAAIKELDAMVQQLQQRVATLESR